MFHFELVSALYFAGLLAATPLTRAGWRRRWQAAFLLATTTASVVALAAVLPPRVRFWVALGYLGAGYWIPALLVSPSETRRFERWLIATDDRWRPLLDRLPTPVRETVEVAYLLCYPLVPMAFLVVWLFGSSADVDRFWTAVLLSSFACFGSLPWLVARPPRLVAGAFRGRGPISRLNTALLNRVSHNFTSFPSGHAALSLAAAATVWPVSPAAGLVLGLIAVAIGIGAASGQYHYVMDVFAGVAAACGAIAVAFGTVSIASQGNDGRSAADTQGARAAMVREQLEARGITDARVLEAMRTVPREQFVPPDSIGRAYDDGPLPIGYGQTISQPYIVAYMSEVLRTEPHHTVLEIGTGSGYQAAVLGRLVREVYTIEIVSPLATRATHVLASLGYANVHVRDGDGYAGWPEHAPFDRILLTAAPEQIPQPLIDQLAVGGLLVAPVGEQGQAQWIVIVEKNERGIVERRTIPVQFVPFTRR